MLPRIVPFLLVLLIPALLGGCQSTAGHPVVDTLRTGFWGPPQPTGKDLDPRFAYLRVTAGSRVAFLALGYVDPHPQGGIEVWYSAEREVLRLQNGRLVGATGTLTEWRQVRLPELPAWSELIARKSAFTWERSRDVMPGYRYNLHDTLQLQLVPAPTQSSLVGLDPAGLHWFEELRIAGKSAVDPADDLPRARYAVQSAADGATVIYGEQCLSATLCLTWQRWKATP